MSRDRPQVLVVTTSYPRSDADWAGRFVHDLNVGLTRCGAAVTTLCPAAVGAPSEFQDAGGRVVRVEHGGIGDGPFHGFGLERALLRRPQGLRAVLRFASEAEDSMRSRILRDGADLVVGHWLWPGGVIAARSARGRCPVVVFGHGADLHGLRWGAGRLWRSSLRGCVRAAWITREDARPAVLRATGLSADSVAVRATAADEWIFARSSGGRCPGAELLGVGRLVPSKGFADLIHAAAIARRTVALAGAGPAAGSLERTAARAGVALRLIGAVDRRALAREMQRAAALVVPSRVSIWGRSEGFPHVVVQAALAGCPVIAASVGGLAAVLDDDQLYPSGDVRALADRLQRPESWRVPDFPYDITATGAARELLALTLQ